MAAKSDAEIAKFEYDKKKDAAARPWPTKSMLKKTEPRYTDKDGRVYYSTEDVESKLDESAKEFVAGYMQSWDSKRCTPLWVALPPKTTSGGMPETSEAYTFTRCSDKRERECQVVEATVVKYARERGTGFVIVKWA